jgi:K+-sensing histidine kinase KdpD
LLIITISSADPHHLLHIVLVAAIVTIALQVGYLSGGFISTGGVGISRSGSELILPLLVSVTAIVLTTVTLSIIDGVLGTRHLVMGYLLPATLIAIYYGSTFAVFTSFASGITAAYVLLPPKFSFRIDNYLDVAELGFFILLALVATKAVGAFAHRR